MIPFSDLLYLMNTNHEAKSPTDDHNLQDRKLSFTNYRYPEGTLNAEHHHTSLRNSRRRK